jgi:Iron-containing redox enzyme
MPLPTPRGPLSEALLRTLEGHDTAPLAPRAARVAASSADHLTDDDAQLSLYLMYELHYGGLGPAADRLEWDADVLAARAELERRLEAEVRAACPVQACSPRDLPRVLFDLAAEGSGPGSGSVPGFVARQATVEQVAELLVLRSPYQLKEGDPQTWAIPRLRGRAKAALVEIQSDEYGGGRADRMHAELFATSMRALGLDDTPNAYLDHVPVLSLANVNVLSMFGLHRRLRGALCGHLAAFEMTSSLPSKRMVAGMQRLGLGQDAWEFFDEHIEADAVHEQVAAHDLCGGLVADEPELVPDVLLGATACLELDARVGAATLTAWRSGRSALREQLADQLGEAVTA